MPRMLAGAGRPRYRICQSPKCKNLLPLNSTKARKYCSKTCYTRAYFRGWYAKHPKQPDAWADRMCAFCGGPYQIHLKSRRKKEYCSRVCRTRMNTWLRKVEGVRASNQKKEREQTAAEHDFPDALQVSVAARCEEHHEADESNQEREVDEHGSSLPSGDALGKMRRPATEMRHGGDHI